MGTTPAIATSSSPPCARRSSTSSAERLVAARPMRRQVAGPCDPSPSEPLRDRRARRPSACRMGAGATARYGPCAAARRRPGGGPRPPNTACRRGIAVSGRRAADPAEYGISGAAGRPRLARRPAPRAAPPRRRRRRRAAPRSRGRGRSRGTPPRGARSGRTPVRASRREPRAGVGNVQLDPAVGATRREDDRRAGRAPRRARSRAGCRAPGRALPRAARTRAPPSASTPSARTPRSAASAAQSPTGAPPGRRRRRGALGRFLRRVRPREREQVVDEPRASRSTSTQGGVGAARLEVLEAQPERHRRRPQLVRRVGDERLLRVQQRLELRRGRVERPGQRPQLGRPPSLRRPRRRAPPRPIRTAAPFKSADRARDPARHHEADERGGPRVRRWAGRRARAAPTYRCTRASTRRVGCVTRTAPWTTPPEATGTAT